VTTKAFTQSLNTIDYNALYNESQKKNFFLGEEFKQLREVNEQLVHRLEQLLKLSFGSNSETISGNRINARAAPVKAGRRSRDQSDSTSTRFS
jgi:hypothetical protein